LWIKERRCCCHKHPWRWMCGMPYLAICSSCTYMILVIIFTISLRRIITIIYIHEKGRSACQGCSEPAYYLPSASSSLSSFSSSACLPCPAGTYMPTTTTTSVTCLLCPENTYTPFNASTTCLTCPNGMRPVPNRTACFQCPLINTTMLPFVEYFQSGCAIRCKPYVSYMRTNPYIPGGCANCSSLTIPVGVYADPISCITWRACTNAPQNALYTSASSEIGSSKCDWKCNTGYYRDSSSTPLPVCAQCVYIGFNATVHQPTTGCLFGCKPHIYSNPLLPPPLKCDQPCVDLLLQYNSGNILIAARVRDYFSNTTSDRIKSRPRYMQGVCGADDETVPFSNLPFLRRGRWSLLYNFLFNNNNNHNDDTMCRAFLYDVELAAPQPTPAEKAAACGNALLDVDEACDDGNSVSGDGCSAFSCTVETDRYWDCDLVGTPCLPNCGWQATTPSSSLSAWTLSLQGYVLPACGASNGGGGGCSCANLSNYDVAHMPVIGARTQWCFFILFYFYLIFGFVD